MTTRTNDPRVHSLLLLVFVGFLVWSAIDPRDRFTWWLEVLPALVAAVVLIATYRRFTLTTLAYVLITIHGIILVVGGHYTYADMPWFDRLQSRFDLERNYYDRLGHFAQGFVPAIVAREILLRRSPLRPGRWLFVLVVAVCLSISAGYELVEWAVAVGTGSSADAFLGSQGDVWDSQWDMFLAMCGSIVALMTLGSLHDRALSRIGAGDPRRG